MSVPKVAIVGRPNVGKSSLFNWLAGRRIAVVDATAGVTRDRVEHLVHADDREFELVDTGGMGIEDPDLLTADIERQIQHAIEEAALILFVVDAQAGLVPLDRDVARRLQQVDKPIVLVVNKCDSDRLEQDAVEFFGLVDAPVVMTSVKGRRNRRGLVETVLESLPPAPEEERPSEERELKLAIVGRRNVGKSTFINVLAEQERVIVSEVPGTTRDSIDIHFEVDGKKLIAIDTPGVRRRKSIASDVEFYGLVRSRDSIRRADVVLMFFDATKTISKVDKQLVEEIRDNFKPCVFVVNKWDLGLQEGMTTEAWTEYLSRAFPDMRYVPIAFITARQSRNVKKLVNLAQAIDKQARTRVSTGLLNRVVRSAVKRHPPPVRRNKRPKIYFAVQVAVEPPTIVLKCNDPELFDESWKRYLLGVLGQELPYPEVAIRLHFRPRAETEEQATPESQD